MRLQLLYHKSHHLFGLLFSIFLVFCGESSIAQFNSQIGYTVSYMKAENQNSIIDKFNGRDSLLLKMKNLHYINGFNAGISYRFNALRIVSSWESQTAKKTGVLGSITGTTSSEKKLYFYFNSISLGLELLQGSFGLGSTVDYNMFRIKTTKSGVSSKLNIVKDEYFSNRFYLIFYTKLTRNLGVQLKPFISFPWQNIDIGQVADYMEISNPSDYNKSDNTFYGLTFNILNGKQKK